MKSKAKTDLEIRIYGNSLDYNKRNNEGNQSIVLTISLFPIHLQIIDKCLKQNLFSNRSELIRFCLNNSLSELLEMLDKFINYEVIELDKKTVKIVRRIE